MRPDHRLIVIILAIILSTSDLGGIRVVQVVFAPMSLVNEALTFPGIPIVAHALAISMAAARRWAWRLGLGALALVGVYLVVVIPLSGPILTHVFGPEFKQFTPLVLPTALSAAAGGGRDRLPDPVEGRPAGACHRARGSRSVTPPR